MDTAATNIQPGPRFERDIDDIRYSLFDIDETLVAQHSMELPTQRFLAATHNAGEKALLGVVSARSLSTARHIIDAANMKGLSILGNGAQLYDSTEGIIKIERPMPTAATTEILRTLQLRNNDHAINDDGVWWQSVPGGYRNETGDAKGLIVSSVVPRKPFAIAVHSLTDAEVKELIDLGNQYGDMNLEASVVHENKADDGSKTYDIFFADTRANKQTALAEAAELLGVEMGNTMMTGDGLNDVGIIGAAGTGVAMGNAAEHAKQVATHIAPSYEQDGAAIALEELVLRRK